MVHRPRNTIRGIRWRLDGRRAVRARAGRVVVTLGGTAFALLPAAAVNHPKPEAQIGAVGMSRQITVRLPDDLVEIIDQQIAHGRSAKRAAVVAAAVARERLREIATRDGAILSRAGRDPGS